jgi:hypothetical protein
METYLEFFKLNGIWYADIPENSLEENEMVLGSDEFLENVVGDCKRVAMDLTTEEPDSYLVKLSITMHDDVGGEYILSGKLIDKIENDGTSMPMTAWICNATHTVFGEHPDVIFIKNIYKFVPIVVDVEE